MSSDCPQEVANYVWIWAWEGESTWCLGDLFLLQHQSTSEEKGFYRAWATMSSGSLCLQAEQPAGSMSVGALADTHALASDALQFSWQGEMGYAFPPFALMGKCLQKVHQEGCTLVIVTPTWDTQPWYPVILELLVEYPILLLPHQQDPFNRPHPLLVNNQRVESIRESHLAEGISKRASDLILSGWSAATYQLLHLAHPDWCATRKLRWWYTPAIMIFIFFLVKYLAKGAGTEAK